VSGIGQEASYVVDGCLDLWIYGEFLSPVGQVDKSLNRALAEEINYLVDGKIGAAILKVFERFHRIPP
jgi:hypothetical protein